MRWFVYILLVFLSFPAYADEFNENEIRELELSIKHNFKAFNDRDINEYMKDIHPDSPVYAGTKDLLSKLFKIYRLKISLLDMKPLMIDEDYFILRAKQKSIKISGKAAYDNTITDVLHVYKKYNNKWALWSSMVLDIKYIDN